MVGQPALVRAVLLGVLGGQLPDPIVSQSPPVQTAHLTRHLEGRVSVAFAPRFRVLRRLFDIHQQHCNALPEPAASLMSPCTQRHNRMFCRSCAC